MKDIKEKPEMGKPKAKSKGDLLPKQAARIMKEKYIRELKQRPEQNEGGDAYAADQVEDAGRRAVDTLADAAGPRRTQQRKAKQSAAEGAAPERQPVSSYPSGQETVAGDGYIPERTANPPKERRLVEQRNTVHRDNGTASSKRAADRTATPTQFPRTPDTQPGQGYAPPSGYTGDSSATRSHRPTGGNVRPDTTATVYHKAPEQAAYDMPQSARPRQQRSGNMTEGASGHAQAPSMTGDRRTAKETVRPADRRRGGQPEKRATAKSGVKSENPRKGKYAIKERPRTAFSPKTRAGAKAGPKTGPDVPRTGRAVGKQAAKKVRQQAQSQAARRMAAQAAKTARATAATAKRIAVAVVKAAAAAIGAIAGIAGGAVLLVALIIVVVIAAVANSPFGLFFAQEQNGPDTVSVAQAVAAVNVDFNSRLEALQAGEYDNITVEGQPPAWADVLAVFAAKTAGADGGVDVATLDADRVAKLTAVFWDMTTITTNSEEIEHPASGETPAWTETVLTITITPKTADAMRTAYGFTEYQNSALDELLADRAALTTLAGDLSITDTDAKDLLAALPEDLSPQRREVVETACRLVGKVNYFWGGKSLVLGWDGRWGQLQKVWAEGSSTTGTWRPYGLDCSGMVDWVFYNVSGGAYIIGHGGGAMMQHTYCTAISWDEAQPGDLVFYPEDEHVGIVGGRDENGNLLVVHCASSYNNVVITGISGFTSIARPNYYAIWE